MKQKFFLAAAIVLTSSFILPSKKIIEIFPPAPFAYAFAAIDAMTGTLNPANYISLYKLSVGKTNRTLTTNNDGTANNMLIPVTIVSIDQLLCRIAVTGAILPGEYAFVDKTTTTAGGNVTVWTFGID